METCDACDAELDGHPCAACAPRVDLDELAALEQGARWQRAAGHRIDEPVRRWAAAVVTTATTELRGDADLPITHHRLYLRDRDGADHRLAVDDEQVRGLAFASLVLAFTRGDRVVELWPMEAPAVTAAAPPARVAALAALAAVDRDAVASADEEPVAIPLAHHRVPLAVAAVGVVALMLPIALGAVATVDAATSRVLFASLWTLAAVALGTGLLLAAQVKRSPVLRHLVVVLGPPAPAAHLDVIDARGERRRWPASAAVRAAPRGQPCLLCTHRGVAFTTIDVPGGAPADHARITTSTPG